LIAWGVTRYTMKCEATTAKGFYCNETATNGKYCEIHSHSRLVNGPHTQEQKELGYRHKRFLKEYQAHIATSGLSYSAQHAMLRTKKCEFDLEMAQMIREQKIWISENGGIDPDTDANMKKLNKKIQNNQKRMERRAARQGGGGFIQVMPAVDDAVEWGGEAEPAEGLAALAADPQNVHTTVLSDQTNAIIEIVRKIPVPPEYAWDPDQTSLTPFEIGMTCKLTQKAAKQMMDQYVVSTDGLEPGIYGKVLDCVWQYTKTSEHKGDICKRIKEEMEDNIGMCAQGNLVRICNILSGYLEGVVAPESRLQKVGRLFSALMAFTSNPNERLGAAYAILTDNEIPESDWETWLSPIME
jgi:hypothetical protein